MELVMEDQPQSGNRALFVCPYHSWAYASDGSLMNVPFEEGFKGDEQVNLDERNLIQLPSGEHRGILFVVSHPELSVDYGAMFAEDLRPKLEKELMRQEKDIWKLPLDSIEGAAHFKSAHPGLREQFADQSSVCGSWGFYPGPPHQGAGEAGAQ